MSNKFSRFDTVFWSDPDDGKCSGDYTVIDVSGDTLTLEADDGSEVEALESECSHREWRDEQFPNWALCYFVNGDGSSLTEEEMKQVDAYVERMREEGYTMENVTDDTNEFCAWPAFGLACDTTRVRFYKPMKDEVVCGVDIGNGKAETVVVTVDSGEIVDVKAVKAD